MVISKHLSSVFSPGANQGFFCELVKGQNANQEFIPGWATLDKAD